MCIQWTESFLLIHSLTNLIYTRRCRIQYGEQSLKRIHVLALVLVACLCVSVGFNVYQYTKTFKILSRTFVFEWSPEEQNIVNGTLRINITFMWKAENLCVTARINDHEYHSKRSFGLIFDMNHDGNITSGEKAYLFRADNTTRPAFFGHGAGFFVAMVLDQPSPYHTCVFDSSGYTFNISLKLNLKNDLVQVCYPILPEGVWVRFHFGLEV